MLEQQEFNTPPLNTARNVSLEEEVHVHDGDSNDYIIHESSSLTDYYLWDSFAEDIASLQGEGDDLFEMET